MIIRKIESRSKTMVRCVAAYARVSTLREEQEESYETQMKNYSRQIVHTPGWKFVKVYADRGISGTSAEKRPEFMQMINDAKNGNIHIVLVKSISRFSRNIVDAQKYTRLLKTYDCEVRFEQEGISSFDVLANTMFDVLCAAAQEESRSISENVKWAYQKQAEKGIRRLGNNRVLGYDEINGVLTPNSDAWIIRQIFQDYASGIPMQKLIQRLSENGASRLRAARPFSSANIQYILKNEIYKGDRKLQKSAPIHFLTKKPDEQQPYKSYYIQEDHEPLISRELWDCVRERLNRECEERQRKIFKNANAHALYGYIFCAECGNVLKRRTMQYRGVQEKVWKCAERLKGNKGNGCKNPVISEKALIRAICMELGFPWNEKETVVLNQILSNLGRVDVMPNGNVRVHRKQLENACL